MPRPAPDLDTQPFWDGCREHRFLLPRCEDCQSLRWPPGPMCPECQSMRTTWVPSTGRGHVYSWIVASHPVAEVLVDQPPYAVGMIELTEGVRVVGNVLGCDPDEITAGMAVELFFEPPEDDGGYPLPNFTTVERTAP